MFQRVLYLKVLIHTVLKVKYPKLEAGKVACFSLYNRPSVRHVDLIHGL